MLVKLGTEHVVINALPNTCPFCHKTIIPEISDTYYNRISQQMEMILHCANSECSSTFIAYYDIVNSGRFDFTNKITIGNLISRDFNQEIKNISPQFLIIYNQAFAAEQQNLHEICGVGYRKALEYLLKDYAIKENPDKEDNIKKMQLSNVIQTYVNDPKINSVAKRATWLGNDETHYVRKWEGKDLRDLKTLIELTVHWIEMESLTKSFENDMPEK